MTGRPERGRFNFYQDAFDDEDQELLWLAHRVEGIDDEVAALRLSLQKQLSDRPETYDRVLRNAELLVRAVAAKYRMSPKSAEDFAERLTQTLRDLGDQLAPGLFGGGGDV
jgi:hypothetical protein